VTVIEPAKIVTSLASVTTKLPPVSEPDALAATDSGNPLSAEMQQAKLALVVELAQEIWGSA